MEESVSEDSLGFLNCDILNCFSSDKEQLVEEEDDELKEVLDLRKIAVQLLQQEQQNRCLSHSRTASGHTPTALPHFP